MRRFHAPDGGVIAFSDGAMAPLNQSWILAAPARLTDSAELIRVTARHLAGEAPPGEEIRSHEVAWKPERQAHWHALLEMPGRLVEAAVPGGAMGETA